MTARPAHAERAADAAQPFWHAIPPEWRGKLKRAGMAASVAFVTVLVGDFMRGDHGHGSKGGGHAAHHHKHGSHAERHQHRGGHGHGRGKG